MKMIVSKEEKKTISTVIVVAVALAVVIFLGVTFKNELKAIGQKFVDNSKEIINNIGNEEGTETTGSIMAETTVAGQDYILTV